MKILTIDFETYYDKDYGLKKYTTEGYINSDLFEVIGVSVKVGDAPAEWFSGDMQSTKEFLMKFDWENSCMLAHNSLFDASILAWRFDIHPKILMDTLGMARALHGVDVSVSLAELAKRYQIGEKGKEVVTALGKHRIDFSEEDLKAYGSYCVNDTELCYILFNLLRKEKEAIRFPNNELRLIDHTLKCYTEPQLHLDIDLLKEHLDEVVSKKEKLLQDSRCTREVLSSSDQFAKLLEEQGVEPPKKLNPKGKEIYAFAKTDEEFKELLEHDNIAVQALVAARLGVKSTLEETRTQRFIDIYSRNNKKVPIALQYYGARTGRWSALDKQNIQNVPRGSKLKSAFIAPPGYVIVGADLSNVELRVGLWLAGQDDKLLLLRKGQDLYIDFAADVFQVKYKEVTKEQRQIGKTAQLSLIYQTGASKLQRTIKVMSGIDIGPVKAKEIVDLYRDDYIAVVQAWKDGESILTDIGGIAASNKYYGNAYLDTIDPDTGEVIKNGLVETRGAHGIFLPSGLYIKYNNLERVKEDNGRLVWRYKIRRGYEYVYGGKAFQGVTQAVARCIMAEAWNRIAQRYRVAFTVHDSLYWICPEEEAEESLRFGLDELKRTPTWMPELPLDAEGGYGKTWADC